VKILEIIDGSSRVAKPKKFTKQIYNGQRVLLTDTSAPTWKYVFLNTDPNTYTGLFVDAMVAQMAARLAMPLTRKRELRAQALQDYELLITRASASDANEQSLGVEPDYTAPWLADRGYQQYDPLLTTDADGDIIEIPGSM
jgi:hypothetical protein